MSKIYGKAERVGGDGPYLASHIVSAAGQDYDSAASFTTDEEVPGRIAATAAGTSSGGRARRPRRWFRSRD